MMPKRRLLGIGVDDRYRTIPEGLIIETLMLVGWAHDTDSPEAWNAAASALQSWIRAGLGFIRAANGDPLFDPVEVYNFMKRAGLEGKDGFWRERVVETRSRLVSSWAADLSPNAPNCGKRQFRIDFKRRYNLSAIPAGTSLRLRAPLPVAGDQLDDLEIEPFVVAGEDVKIHRSEGRLEVRMVASGGASATLGATLAFTARLQEPSLVRPITDDERALYLSGREGWVVVSERIRTLASSLAATGVPAMETVRSFWEYIHAEMISGVIHYDQVDAASPCDWTLDAGWFDCQLGCSLFIALCRARGIPARLVGGYFLYPQSPTNHFWAEVWIEDRGWTPFDFMAWDIRRAGGDPNLADRFFGRLDYRMTCERLPRVFVGALGVPIPAPWFLLQAPKPGGVEIALTGAGGTAIYTDSVRMVG
jgi:hypothetical protein